MGHPRPLPHQDPHKASHEGRREGDVRQGDQGESKASKDHRESLPSGCTEEADLEKCPLLVFPASPEVHLPWESHGVGLEGMSLALGQLTFILYIYRQGSYPTS